jgi:hypothetical protein
MPKIILVIFSISIIGCTTTPKKFRDLNENDYQHKSTTVNGETIYFKTAVTKSEPQKFRDLDSNDIKFMNNCRSSADSILKKSILKTTLKDISIEELDELIDLYNSNKIKYSQNKFVNSIGVVFGDLLNAKLKMKWVVVEDESGHDYGITIEKIMLTNFPLNSISKAIEQKRDNSLKTIYLMTINSINELNNK